VSPVVVPFPSRGASGLHRQTRISEGARVAVMHAYASTSALVRGAGMKHPSVSRMRVYVSVYVAKGRVLLISIKWAFLSFIGGHSLRHSYDFARKRNNLHDIARDSAPLVSTFVRNLPNARRQRCRP
jgi:hypothetical protein